LAVDNALVTRRKDGTLVLVAWNMAEPGTTGPAKEVEFKFENARISSVELTRLDPDSGDVHKAYAAMGSPRYPTREQIEGLRKAAALSPSERHEVHNSSLMLRIPSHGLVLIEAKPVH
jgi:xylan 1,4-beta-xylosidase